MEVDLPVCLFQKFVDGIHMVEMGVGDEGGGDLHSVFLGLRKNFAQIPGRIDDATDFLNRAADEVNEILERPYFNLAKINRGVNVK